MEISILQSDADLEAVYRLTHDQYVKSGYIQPRPDGMLKHYSHLDHIPETTIILAKEDGQVIGTNSITLDGSAGLPVDADTAFRDIVRDIRDKCAKTSRILANSWRLVIAPKSSLDVSLHLISANVEQMYIQHVHTCLYTVNPKHEGYYKKLCGMITLAYGDCNTLDSPPAVLMLVDYPSMLATWKEFCRRRGLECRADS